MFILTFVLSKFCISDGGSGEGTHGTLMPTTSSIANMNSDIIETAIPTATTITPKSMIAKGEPIKQSQWLSGFLTFQIWNNVLKQSLSPRRSLLYTPVSEMCTCKS